MATNYWGKVKKRLNKILPGRAEGTYLHRGNDVELCHDIWVSFGEGRNGGSGIPGRGDIRTKGSIGHTQGIPSFV